MRVESFYSSSSLGSQAGICKKCDEKLILLPQAVLVYA